MDTTRPSSVKETDPKDHNTSLKAKEDKKNEQLKAREWITLLTTNKLKTVNVKDTPKANTVLPNAEDSDNSTGISTTGSRIHIYSLGPDRVA